MKIVMMPDTAEALLHELNFLLPPDWLLHAEKDRFRIAPPKSMHTLSGKSAQLHEQAWKIAQFVGYARFTSVERDREGSYVIRSLRDEESGFEIVVHAVPQHFADSRPKPFVDDDPTSSGV